MMERAEKVGERNLISKSDVWLEWKVEYREAIRFGHLVVLSCLK